MSKKTKASSVIGRIVFALAVAVTILGVTLAEQGSRHLLVAGLVALVPALLVSPAAFVSVVRFSA